VVPHGSRYLPDIDVDLSLAVLALAVCSLPAHAKEEKKEEKLGTVIGIDLGTTYSCVGVYKNGRVEIIANDQVRSSERQRFLLMHSFHIISVLFRGRAHRLASHGI